MPVIYSENNCVLITHDRNLHSYQENSGNLVKYQLKEIIFDNFKRKQKIKSSGIADEITEITSKIKSFLTTCKSKNFFKPTEETVIDNIKAQNIELMNRLYESSSDFGYFHGENNFDDGRFTTINNNCFLIPPHSKFFNKKIEDIVTFLPLNDTNKFDLIVIDPPWKNRYIKRVKKNSSHKQGYCMMSDDEIVKIPLENYITKTSIILIWCTNSDTHISAIKENFLKKWKIKLLSTWQWIKVDKNGELFCAIDGNKKPFEQIFIATHEENFNYDKELEKDLMVFSQPSSIHSHKPPLMGKRN
jgi:N(6)-adenine-specific DNA methyltransferase